MTKIMEVEIYQFPCFKMKKGQEKLWRTFVDENSSTVYERQIVEFTIKWVTRMEEAISKKASWQKVLEEVYNNLEHFNVDYVQRNEALSILTRVWVYGEELRRYHNSRFSYEGDGWLYLPSK